MVTRIYNLGSGDDLFRGNTSISHQIVNGGRGADIIVTGGAWQQFAFREANAGMKTMADVMSGNHVNKMYSDILVGFDAAWVGGHFLKPDGFWNEYHEYHGGAGDHIRITIPANRGQLVNDEFLMHIGAAQGVAAYHGPKIPNMPLWVRSFDDRVINGENVQQISLQAKNLDALTVEDIRGVITREGDHFDFKLTHIWFSSESEDNPSAEDYLKVTKEYMRGAQETHIDMDGNTRADMFEAGYDLLARWDRQDVLLFDM